MNRLVPFVVCGILLSAFLFGWLVPAQPEEPLGLSRRAVSSAGLTLRPGETVAQAVKFLKSLRSDPLPPPPPPPPPPVVAPPPPLDVAIVFKHTLTGIERDPLSGAYSALVRDPAASGQQVKGMVVGDAFGDGWRIVEISAQAVVLSKDRDTRVVRLYG